MTSREVVVMSGATTINDSDQSAAISHRSPMGSSCLRVAPYLEGGLEDASPPPAMGPAASHSPPPRPSTIGTDDGHESADGRE